MSKYRIGEKFQDYRNGWGILTVAKTPRDYDFKRYVLTNVSGVEVSASEKYLNKCEQIGTGTNPNIFVIEDEDEASPKLLTAIEFRNLIEDVTTTLHDIEKIKNNLAFIIEKIRKI